MEIVLKKVCYIDISLYFCYYFLIVGKKYYLQKTKIIAMKKIYLFILLLALSMTVDTVFGQTVITRANHAPFEGLFITVNALDVDIEFEDPLDIDPGTAGTNQNWDFSTFTSNLQIEQEFMTPENSPYAEDVSNWDTNLAGVVGTEDAGIGTFFKISNDEMLIVGQTLRNEQFEEGISVEFNPPLKAMEFPFAYGQSFNTRTAFDLNIEIIRVAYTSSSMVEADAWGTIITPEGTYNNVLRVKTTSMDTTALFLGPLPLEQETATSVSYDWYSSNRVFPVFSIQGILDENFSVTNVSYLSDQTVSTNDLAILHDFNIYPVPASEFIFVESPNDMDDIRVRLFNMSGSLVMDHYFNNAGSQIQLNVSDLKTGLYTIQMIQNQRIVNVQKIVITH
jgi:hypothetical protein